MTENFIFSNSMTPILHTMIHKSPELAIWSFYDVIFSDKALNDVT